MENTLEKMRVSEISPEHTVTQSNELIMSRQDLNIQERRIIYAFASLIHKNDQDFKIHRVKVKDIADILGIQTKNYYKKVQELVTGLQQKGVYVRRENSELYVNWVASSEYFHGQGCVELEFSRKMQPYLLELKERFTPFKLRNVLRLRSEYSMRIYELLKKDEYLKKVRYEVEDLRHMLNIEKQKYRPYANFKNRVIKKAHEELGKYTDLTFEFEEIKKGRRVVSIEFTIQKNDKYVELVINESDHEEIISLMNSYGVAKKQSQKLIKEFGKDQVVRNTEYIASQNHNNFRNVAGAIVEAIRNDYAAVPSSLTNAEYASKDTQKETAQELINKYKNSREPIPGWLLREQFQDKLKEKKVLSEEEIQEATEEWVPKIKKAIK